MIYEWAMNSTYGSALHATACSSGCESWLCWLGLGFGFGLGLGVRVGIRVRVRVRVMVRGEG